MKLWKRLLWRLRRYNCRVCGSPIPHDLWYVDWPYTTKPGFYCANQAVV